MATNTTLLESPEWWRNEVEKMAEPFRYSELMSLLTDGLEERSTGAFYIQPALATDSTICTRPDVKISYTLEECRITNGTPKLTPELQAAIDAQAKAFASTILSRMEREMMITFGYCETRASPKTTLQTLWPLWSGKPCRSCGILNWEAVG